MYYSSRFGVDWYTHNEKGGKYWVEDTSRKIQVDNEWVEAITYSDVDRNEYVRSMEEFSEKFTRETAASNRMVQANRLAIDDLYKAAING